VASAPPVDSVDGVMPQAFRALDVMLLMDMALAFFCRCRQAAQIRCQVIWAGGAWRFARAFARVRARIAGRRQVLPGALRTEDSASF
jgi:hypothetical protein